MVDVINVVPARFFSSSSGPDFNGDGTHDYFSAYYSNKGPTIEKESLDGAENAAFEASGVVQVYTQNKMNILINDLQETICALSERVKELEDCDEDDGKV